ncbi:GNAT family N-acetyltransferase [Georgenia halophila]|uniref:GNAT family N-acetyltransferase n=1 Tax=Georgenia halophila TaxID=620889 RepID=UPI003CD08250
MRVRPGRSGDADALAELAAATFPLACPPELGEADIAAFVAENLGAARFASYLTDARYRVQVAETSGGLVGYTLVVLPSTAEEPPDAEDVAALVPDRPAAELSKCYVLPAFQGSGVAGALLEAVRREVAAIDVEGRPVAVLWLGTNAANRRARAGYGKHGYTTVGPRRFQVGEQPMEDVVMALGLTAEPGDNRR